MFTISNVSVMLALFIIVVSIFAFLFISLKKEEKDERQYYESLSERKKKEYAMEYNKEMQTKHSSVVAHSISGSGKF